MKIKKAREARHLLKERFDYAVFLYQAEKVGITATGELDQNELYPNPSVPAGLQETCLEAYQRFRQAPDSFLIEGQ
jgi:type I restriction enzyme M protein